MTSFISSSRVTPLGHSEKTMLMKRQHDISSKTDRLSGANSTTCLADLDELVSAMQMQLLPQDAILKVGICPDQVELWLVEARELTEHDVMFDGELLELDASVISSNDDLLSKHGTSIRQVINEALERLCLSSDAERRVKERL